MTSQAPSKKHDLLTLRALEHFDTFDTVPAESYILVHFDGISFLASRNHDSCNH